MEWLKQSYTRAKLPRGAPAPITVQEAWRRYRTYVTNMLDSALHDPQYDSLLHSLSWASLLDYAFIMVHLDGHYPGTP
jgi:hypothetical protein